MGVAADKSQGSRPVFTNDFREGGFLDRTQFLINAAVTVEVEFTTKADEAPVRFWLYRS